jgi:hypothetical protein
VIPSVPKGIRIVQEFRKILQKRRKAIAAAAASIDVDRPSVRTDNPQAIARAIHGADHDLRGVTEPALIEALTLATTAGQWTVVAKLAAELEARRAARGAPDGLVVPMARSKA